jgi:transcriptional regulator GlxA family with amidase domain
MKLQITQSDSFTEDAALRECEYCPPSVPVVHFSFEDSDCEIAPGIWKAIRTIREDYSRPHTVSSLARECGMSVRSLHRLYRAVTGNTVGKDLLARRIEAAADMLREDDLKLEPVAMETGLRNAKNLCRLFKEHLGLTPGQWKESFHGSCARSA